MLLIDRIAVTLRRQPVNQSIGEIEAETFAALRQRYAPRLTFQLAVLLAGGVAAAAFVLALPAFAWVLL